jgi:hypothetical protein
MESARRHRGGLRAERVETTERGIEAKIGTRSTMASRADETGLGGARVLDADEVEGVLSGAFYSPPPQASRGGGGARARNAEPKPAHYKVICISLYTKDLERLDALVTELKARGITKANRSALIRVALEQVDLDRVPRGL